MSHNFYNGTIGRLARLTLSAFCLAGLAFSMLPVQAARAATYTVNTLTDESDFSCSDGDCSLRDAIAVAAASGDTINFSVTGTITLTMGPLTVDKSLTIQGPGASILTITAVAGQRIFIISSTGSLAISGVAITNASISLFGAGFYVNQGNLSITDSLVQNNSTAGSGGGIYNSQGTVSIANSTFTTNNADSSGGGVYNEDGNMTITNSTFLLNTATDGGGVYNYAITYGRLLTVSHSSFIQNSATMGGGIYNYIDYSQFNISSSNFSSNQATQSGGAIFQESSISSTIANTTFDANSAGQYGGGISNASYLTVQYATFYNNTAAVSGGGVYTDSPYLTVKSTIIAASTGGNCGGTALKTGSSGMADDATCAGFTQKTLVQLKLGDLTGTPAYYPLAPGSLAIDADPAGSCAVSTDQRGQSRPLDGDGNGTAACDFGSYEREEVTTTVINSDNPDPSGYRETVSVNVTVNGPGLTPTGTVDITGTDSNCSITLVSGSGSCNVRFDSLGSKTITATYNGDSAHTGSFTTNGHTVNQANTTTTITLDDPDPSLINNGVTVNFTVESAGGTPTGNVTVSDGVDSCFGTVAGGTCTISLRTLGARTLTATYAGDVNFSGSSDTEPHQVKADTTTSIISDDPDPSIIDRAFSVHYDVYSPEGIPTGNVTVSDGVDECTGTVEEGMCSITLTTAGDRTLTATYDGDADFNGSSDTESHQVKVIPLDEDADGDGILTRYEDPDPNMDDNPDDARDSDGDSLADYLDNEDDGDGIRTIYEQPDFNGDKNPDDATDTDCDGIPDYLDTDDDGDGIFTVNEHPDPNMDGNPSDAWDSDSDGTPDYLDVSNVPVITEGASTSVTMSEDGSPTAFSLTLHATDADGNTITWDISAPAGHGNATASGTGNSKAIGYVPAANYHGTDSFVVRVNDGVDGTDTITVNVTINSVNDAPTNITLSNSTLTENRPSGTTVGTLTTTDVDTGETYTYTLVSTGCTGTDNGSFQISGSSLKTAAKFDYETKHSYTICIQTSDGHGGTFKKQFTITVTDLPESFKSAGAYDGWVLESSETSGVGGTMNSNGSTVYVGDNAQKKQYRGILSFDTAALPDTAVITKVTLKLKLQGTIGANPFNTHGSLLVDIRKGAFGANALELTDFQATASKSNIGSIPKTPVSGWYTKTFGSTAFTYINKKGVTQFRLRFTKDDDNDLVADYLKFYSGNANASYQPQLIVEYYVP